MTPDRRALDVVIVDDERPARQKLRRFLGDEDGIRIVGEASDGASAAEAVREHRPDLLFLDIRMPGAGGFDVLESLDDVRPHVVFVTAYEEHAVRAFDVGAVDYLLKPFDRTRFKRALERVIDRMESDDAAPDPATLERVWSALRSLGAAGTAHPPLERILVRKGDRSFFIATARVDWLEAAGNYVRVHAGEEAHLIRSTLKHLEERLDPGRFARIGRGAIVNLDRVREIHDWSHGDRLIVLVDGTQLKLSRRYRKRIEG